MNTFMPWFVTVAVLGTVGMVFWSYATFLPITPFAVLIMVVVSLSGSALIFCFFRIYAIFERMDRREEEWKARTKGWYQ